MAKKKLSFEQALNRLEEIVNRLEDGEVTLEESIALYKEGMELSVICKGTLDQAQAEISLLQQNQNGELEESSFEFKEN